MLIRDTVHPRTTPETMLGSDEPIQSGEDELDLSDLGGGEPVPTNRPAANANLSSSTEAMTGDFDVSDDADDFLGLENEVETMSNTTDAIDDSAISMDDDGELQLSDGWLLEIPVEDRGEEPGLPTVVGAAPPTAHASTAGEAVVDEHAPVEGEDWGDEPYDEEDELAEEGELDEELVVAAGPDRRRLALIGFCVGLLTVVGVMMFGGGENEPDVEVATAPNGPTKSATEAPTTGTNPSNETNTEDAPPANPLDGLLSGGAVPTGGGPSGAPNLGAVPTLDPATGLPPLGDTGAVTITDIDPTTSRSPRSRNEPRSLLVRLEDAAESGEVAGFMPFHPADTGLIWTGTEVPLDAVARPGRLLTPGVGIVRATMSSGELFEGKLYAVGSNRVWIELGPGRVGLDGERVEQIDRVADAELVEGLDASETVPGQRVRVRTKGGVLYGRVKTRDGDRVTIVTDKGGRITLDNPTIEPIGRASGLVLKP